MWSLPNIQIMNSEAHSNQKKFENAIRTGKMDRKKLECECKDDTCDGEIRADAWYDIFSDDIKGLNVSCERHDQGTPEGFFYCDGCNRTMIENITWELYYAFHEGSQLCLPCFAEEVLRDESRWITLTDTAIAAVTMTDIKKAPHCIGVEMPIPKGIRRISDVTFDSHDGHGIDGNIDDLKNTLYELKSEGVQKAILILDGGYQFCVSIGVYAPIAEENTENLSAIGAGDGR